MEEQKSLLVKSILQKHAEDSLSYFHLQENRQYFFSPSGKSFLSYRVWNKVAIVAADPVGPKHELELLIRSFVEYTLAWKLKPLFVGLSYNHLTALNKVGMKIFKLGEEAILDLKSFDEKKLKKKVRRVIRHAENSNIEVFFFTPNSMPKSLSRDISYVSKRWLSAKGRKEKGFVMTLGRIPNQLDNDCQFAIALKNSQVLGFLCFTPVYKKKMLSLDISRRLNNDFNGLTEFIIIKSAEYFKARGIEKLSLNFATFSGLPELDTSIKYKILFSFSKILKKLYGSDSLRKFNQKFLPIWETRYIAFSSTRNLPLYLLAILRAER